MFLTNGLTSVELRMRGNGSESLFLIKSSRPVRPWEELGGAVCGSVLGLYCEQLLPSEAAPPWTITTGKLLLQLQV